MKDGKEVTEILEAFDLTGSLRAAAELAGCSANTVKLWVDKRDRGVLGELVVATRRDRLVDPFLDKGREKLTGVSRKRNSTDNNKPH